MTIDEHTRAYVLEIDDERAQLAIVRYDGFTYEELERREGEFASPEACREFARSLGIPDERIEDI